MTQLDRLTKEIRTFCDERGWGQFHKGSNLAISLSLEAAEVLELFQWADLDAESTTGAKRERLSDELADVLYWTLRLADKYEIDLEAALMEKMEQNRLKYPVNKAFGSAKKYTEL